MKPLRKWILDNGTTVKDFAEAIGKPQGTVRKWAYGQRMPRPENLHLITRATKGAVTANEFIEGQKS